MCFENIHPIAEGNGRVGRTLLNYWLMIKGDPPVIIYAEDKRSYYDALEEYDEEETIAPLVAFLEEQAVKTWKRMMGFAEAPGEVLPGSAGSSCSQPQQAAGTTVQSFHHPAERPSHSPR